MNGNEYVFEAYPAWRYHRDGRAVIVTDAGAEARLTAGDEANWSDTPATFEAQPDAPAAEPTAPADAPATDEQGSDPGPETDEAAAAADAAEPTLAKPAPKRTTKKA